jgi:hypothetical protein
MSNCRLVASMIGSLVQLEAVAEADIRNCLFNAPYRSSILLRSCATDDRVAITNCIFANGGPSVTVETQKTQAAPLRVHLAFNTFATVVLDWVHGSSFSRMDVEAKDNIVVNHNVLLVRVPVSLEGTTGEEQPRAGGGGRGGRGARTTQQWIKMTAEELVKTFRWSGRRNLYPVDLDLVAFGIYTTIAPSGSAVKKEIDFTSNSLDAWNKLWEKPEVGSLVGTPRFAGTNERLGLRASPLKLEPDFWRLAPGSPGKGAGENGRDLGADVDLVGSGAAYERWKKTPAYQEWLKETGQVAHSRE